MPTGLFEDIIAEPVQKTGLFDDIVAPKKTREQVIAEVNKAQAARPEESLGVMGNIGNALYWPGRILSRIDPITAITDALSVGTGGNQFQAPVVSPEAAQKAVEFFTPGIASEGSVGKGIQNFTAGTLSGLSSPHAVAGMLSGKVSPVLPAVTFTPPMVSDIPAATQALSESQGGQQSTEAALRLLANTIFPLMMARGAVTPPKPSGIGYGEIPGPRMEDLPGGIDVAPASRQIPLNTYQGPTEVNPIGGAGFVVDPAARAIAMQQLSPLEQREAMRGPRVFAPREEQVRPAQEAPAIIGEQAKAERPIYYTGLYQDIVEPVVPNKPPVEPSGGEVSFRAPAAAEGIPNALQQAQPNVGENYASTIRSNQAELAKEGYGQEKRAETRSDDLQRIREGTQQAEPSTIREEGKGIGGGIKRAIERNKEAGSAVNPVTISKEVVEKFKEKEKELRGSFSLSGPQFLLDPTRSGFPNPNAQLDSQQIGNRVKNKIPPAEWDIYEKAGIKDFLKGKKTTEEVAKWMQENGPRVEVKTYGQQTRNAPSQARMGQVLHELDTLGYQSQLDGGIVHGNQLYNINDQRVPARVRELANELDRLRSQVVHESSVQPTSAYDTVSPKSTSEFPVERVDVVLPLKKAGEITAEERAQGKSLMWPPDMLHEQYPNTIGWAAVQYDTLPSGEKVAHVFEVQSRWGQTVREDEAAFKRRVDRGDIQDTPASRAGYRESLAREPHPLLQDYNRLILKAAIQQALKRGVKKIVLSDAETAMMSEGHDLAANIPVRRFAGVDISQRYPNLTPTTLKRVYGEDYRQGQYLSHEGKVYRLDKPESNAPENVEKAKELAVQDESHDNFIPQNQGMRLNYDSILPKIMGELTGSKGERVELGEHKNAFNPGQFLEEGYESKQLAEQRVAELGQIYGEISDLQIEPQGPSLRLWRIKGKPLPRENLIFKNENGTPKTSVTGLAFDLSKIPEGKTSSLFEKDRPEQVAQRLYSFPGQLFDPAMYKQVGTDIAKAGKGVRDIASKLGEFYKGAEDKVIPALNFDTKSPLPDLQPKEVANKIWSQPFASEKMPILGRLMGGKARIRTPQDEAIATWYAERHGVGPAIASNIGEQIRGRITSEFKVDEKGNLNVKPTEGPKQSLKMSDVFEALRKNPNAYKLTVGQRNVFNTIIEPLTKRITQLASKYDLIDEVVDESGDFRPYFPRIVTEHPKIQPEKGTSAFKSRAFKTEQEGWDRGYKYETNPEKRLVSGVERLYRAIANQRLAKDPVLGAKSEAQVKAELQEAFSEELGSGAMTQAKIDRIAEGIRTKGQVMQPILIRKIFDPEVAKTLNKEFAAEQSNVMKGIANANSLLKATQLGFDLGVGQIQMLPMLYNNPRIWAQAQFKSLQSMASPKFFAEYARQNKEVISELAQMGSSVGRLQEMMAGLGKGQLLSKVPVVGQVGEAFGRQFQTALDVAKVELWKALRETAPKSEWPKLVRGIETSLLSGRMESAMVPHGRSLLERIALLAPSYYRGAVDSIAGLAEQGASGKVIRNTMSRFILGGLLTYYAAAKMAGMKDDEIKKRLDPTRSDYLNVAIKQDDGSVVNIGFGGIHRSLLRLGANMVKTSVEHPENWKSLAPDKNPLTRWYRGHAGPTISLTWEAATGKDFLGRNSDIASLGTRALPLIAQQAVPPKGEAPAKPVEYLASALGMTATPESFTARKGRTEDQVAQERFGKKFSELSLGQRRSIEKTTEKQLAGVPRGLTDEKSQELAMKKSNERLAKLGSDLSSEAQKWIEDGKVKLRNYETSKMMGKVTVHLTKEETDLLHKNMVAEYQAVFDKLMGNPRISAMPTSDKQRYVDINLEHARTRAWNKTKKSVGKLPQE